jgi:WD40 repeat protein
MSDFDRVLIAPARAEAEQALRLAVMCADAAPGMGRIGWPPTRLADVLNRLDADGRHAWSRGSMAAAACAWWHDYLGRLHLRVVGCRGLAGYPPLPPGPPLAAVYPERVLVRPRDRAVLALCPCGAAGEAAALGWMGPCCGPCFDRRAAGAAPPPAWPLAAGGPVLDAALAPGGERLAALYRGAGARVWDLPSGRRTAAFSVASDDGHRLLSLSPEGRWVVASWMVASSCALDVWDAETGARAARLRTSGVSFAVAPDGSAVYGLTAGVPAVSPLPPTGAWQPFSGPAENQALVLCLSPDGARLATASTSSEVLLWDAADRRLVSRHRLPGPPRSAPAFAPEGRLCHFLSPSAAMPGVVLLFRTLEGRVAAGLPWPDDEGGGQPAWSPDGRLLATVGHRGTLRAWALPEIPGGPGFILIEGNCSRCAFLPDGRLLTFSRRDGAVNLWPPELLRA